MRSDVTSKKRWFTRVGHLQSGSMQIRPKKIRRCNRPLYWNNRDEKLRRKYKTHTLVYIMLTKNLVTTRCRIVWNRGGKTSNFLRYRRHLGRTEQGRRTGRPTRRRMGCEPAKITWTDSMKLAREKLGITDFRFPKKALNSTINVKDHQENK